MASKKQTKFEDMRTSEKLSSLCSFLRSVVKDYQYHESEQKIHETASQDLLHQLEFGEYKDRRRTATMLSKVRKQRRVHKDQIDTLQYIYKYLKDHQKLIFELEAILGETRKAEQKIESDNRFYRARVIKDLPICKQNEENNN